MKIRSLSSCSHTGAVVFESKDEIRSPLLAGNPDLRNTFAMTEGVVEEVVENPFQQGICIDLEIAGFAGEIHRVHELSIGPGCDLPHILPSRRLDAKFVVFAGELDLAPHCHQGGLLFFKHLDDPGIGDIFFQEGVISHDNGQVIQNVVPGNPHKQVEFGIREPEGIGDTLDRGEIPYREDQDRVAFYIDIRRRDINRENRAVIFPVMTRPHLGNRAGARPGRSRPDSAQRSEKDIASISSREYP